MITILCDTREQQNTHITNRFNSARDTLVLHKKLDFGDYSFIYNEISYENKIVIERKSGLNELALNFTKERDRFKREMLRAKEHEAIVILLIENAQLKDIELHNYRSKFHPHAFLGSLRSWKEKYNLFPIFLENKNHSSLYIYNIFFKYLNSKKNII